MKEKDLSEMLFINEKGELICWDFIPEGVMKIELNALFKRYHDFIIFY